MDRDQQAADGRMKGFLLLGILLSCVIGFGYAIVNGNDCNQTGPRAGPRGCGMPLGTFEKEQWSRKGH